jgi:protein-S-isoprenylcysteine O-methyltransferase Ste14
VTKVVVEARTAVRGTAWLFYAAVVLEILFLISPAAPLFYTFYGPVLRFLERYPETAWLTQFFLPHISTTADPILNLLWPLGWVLLGAGTVFFLCSAVPLYWSMLMGRTQVVGGLYRIIRHPQYVGLAIMGFGVLLLWPRFLVLVILVVMLGLYRVFAGTEESQCLARYGESYRAYMERTGRFLPRGWSKYLPRLLPESGPLRIAGGIAIFVLVLAASISAAFVVRSYSLTQVAAVYGDDEAIVSPAPLARQELEAAYRTAIGDAGVLAALAASPPGQRVVYVIPQDWDVLPVEARPDAAKRPDGHARFDHTRYNLLFARARSHDPAARGRDILKDAYGLDPIVVARVDTATDKVTAVEPPPVHLKWADIPTPTF